MARSSANSIGQGSRRSNTISKVIDVIFKIWIFFKVKDDKFIY